MRLNFHENSNIFTGEFSLKPNVSLKDRDLKVSFSIDKDIKVHDLKQLGTQSNNVKIEKLSATNEMSTGEFADKSVAFMGRLWSNNSPLANTTVNYEVQEQDIFSSTTGKITSDNDGYFTIRLNKIAQANKLLNYKSVSIVLKTLKAEPLTWTISIIEPEYNIKMITPVPNIVPESGDEISILIQVTDKFNQPVKGQNVYIFTRHEIAHVENHPIDDLVSIGGTDSNGRKSFKLHVHPKQFDDKIDIFAIINGKIQSLDTPITYGGVLNSDVIKSVNIMRIENGDANTQRYSIFGIIDAFLSNDLRNQGVSMSITPAAYVAGTAPTTLSFVGESNIFTGEFSLNPNPTQNDRDLKIALSIDRYSNIQDLKQKGMQGSEIVKVVASNEMSTGTPNESVAFIGRLWSNNRPSANKKIRYRVLESNVFDAQGQAEVNTDDQGYFDIRLTKTSNSNLSNLSSVNVAITSEDAKELIWNIPLKESEFNVKVHSASSSTVSQNGADISVIVQVTDRRDQAVSGKNVSIFTRHQVAYVNNDQNHDIVNVGTTDKKGQANFTLHINQKTGPSDKIHIFAIVSGKIEPLEITYK